MKTNSEKHTFRVIIVGGGLGGLALARALDLGGIDFVLLEARDVIDPAMGASMGLMGNGLRIMDQLGCYGDIASLSYGIKQAGDHNDSGALIHPRSDAPQLGAKRCGYDTVFLDRRLVLHVIFKRIQSKSKVLLNKRFASVDHTEKGVIVHCEDGSSYVGDILVGADGIYSAVRREMWKCADVIQPGLITEAERRCVSSEYQVLYGMSSATAGLYKGNYDVTYMKDRSTMVITGKENTVYWFIFKKLDRVYHVGEIPRYTKEDAANFAEQNLDINIEKEPKVTFGDIWRNRKCYTLVATEEASFNTWTFARFVCLGDAVHKVTPNAGVGANAAFESAAALANNIKLLLDESSGTPSFESIQRRLKQYELSRIIRATEINKVANSVTRLQALKGVAERITVNYIIPNADDQLIDMMSDLFVGAAKVDFLPPPPRSLVATMPFNPSQGFTKHEHIWYRALLALPFFGLSFMCFRCMNAGDGLSGVGDVLKSGVLSWDHQSFDVPPTVFPATWIDDMFRPITVIFSSSSFGIDIVSWWQVITFLTDLGVLIAIMLIESARRSNMLTFAQVPFFFLMTAQFFGIGVIGPLYFALHYTASQIGKFKASDHRLTNLAYTQTILPVLAGCYYLPLYLGYLAPELSTRFTAQSIWQLFPVWISLAQLLLAKTVVPNTMQHDRLHAPNRDMITIRCIVGFTTILAASAWLCTLVRSHLPLSMILLPDWTYSQTNWMDTIRNILQYDYIFCWASSFLWLGYLFMDLKYAGMVKESWTRIFLIAMLTLVVLGPGATVGLAWLWREEVLATKRHKHAVVGADAIPNNEGEKPM